MPALVKPTLNVLVPGRAEAFGAVLLAGLDPVGA